MCFHRRVRAVPAPPPGPVCADGGGGGPLVSAGRISSSASWGSHRHFPPHSFLLCSWTNTLPHPPINRSESLLWPALESLRVCYQKKNKKLITGSQFKKGTTVLGRLLDASIFLFPIVSNGLLIISYNNINQLQSVDNSILYLTFCTLNKRP